MSGGGSSGGGGGGAGQVSYPSYLETVHQKWLDNQAADTIESSVVDIMNVALGGSPWAAASAYDPSTELTAVDTQVTAFNTLVDLLSSGTGLDTLMTNILDTGRIQDEIDAHKADLDAQLVSDVYPRLEAGMRDINAVISSAFVIGRANVEEGRDREVAKFAASVRSKAFSDDAIKVIQLRLEYEKEVTRMMIESRRIKVVALKEQSDRDDEIDELDAKWDLEVFQYGANLIAAPGGGTAVPGMKPPSKPSVIGGALSGAAMGVGLGAMSGTPFGPMLGGLVGGIGGLLGGLFG